MKRLPLHVFLLGFAPILFIYAHNIRRVPIRFPELVLPMLVLFCLTLVSLVLLTLILRNSRKAGVIISLLLVPFFLYGPIQESAQVRLLPVIIIVVVFAATVGLILRLRSDLGVTTAVLNFTGLVLVLMNLLGAVSARTGSAFRDKSQVRKAERSEDAKTLPDIYYIILDSYVRSDLLKVVYGVDNSEFLNRLREQGFFVAEQSRSNYAHTYFSLASSLNFTYLDSAAQAEGPMSQNMAGMIDMIEQNRLTAFLRPRGYRIVTFASGYTGTELRNADVRLAPLGQLTEFQSLLLRTTLLAGVLDRVTRGLEQVTHARLVRYVMRTLPKISDPRQPSFVFAHVICPHTPFVFDSLGGRPRTVHHAGLNPAVTDRTMSRAQLREWHRTNYGPQVKHLNRLVSKMVEELVSRKRPVIIILQADHGPQFREERYAILNAIRIPESSVRNTAAPGLYDSITPVNTFRVVLSQVFDTTMPLLPDCSYSSPADRPYDFRLVE